MLHSSKILFRRHNKNSSSLFLLIQFLILINLSIFGNLECIRSRIESKCQWDEDCHQFSEFHLYCNKTFEANVCAFDSETYIGHVRENVDCPGRKYSAVPWSNPVSNKELHMKTGNDCMRLCLHVENCFGISIRKNKCYLRNELCFYNLIDKKGSVIGILNVVREDYHCGCHYPFTRKSSIGEIITWNPYCPESQGTNNPYRCCSSKGLCINCNNNSNNNELNSTTTTINSSSKRRKKRRKRSSLKKLKRLLQEDLSVQIK